MRIHDISYDTTTISRDFPGKPAKVICCYGCNRSCINCKRPNANRSNNYTVEDALVLAESPFKTVVVTGGEPLIQSDTPKLLRHLLRKNHKVILETNGSINLPVEASNEFVTVVVYHQIPKGNETVVHRRNMLKNKDILVFKVETTRDLHFVSKVKDSFNAGLIIFETDLPMEIANIDPRIAIKR